MRVVRVFIPLVILFAVAPAAAAAQGAKTYISPDKALRAIITRVGPGGRDVGESLVEIRGARNALLLKKSFASGDGAHGYAVVNAAWTPDSRFFVFSVESSGGHQPWHAPTFVFRRGDRKLLSLDDFVGPISNSHFELRAPDLLDSEKWVEAEHAGRKVTVKLNELSSDKYGGEGASGVGNNR